MVLDLAGRGAHVDLGKGQGELKTARSTIRTLGSLGRDRNRFFREVCSYLNHRIILQVI